MQFTDGKMLSNQRGARDNCGRLGKEAHMSKAILFAIALLILSLVTLHAVAQHGRQPAATPAQPGVTQLHG